MSEWRDPFKIEFSPLPIPTEPPDAPGGFYFYLSRQWAAYVRGAISILGYRRFWQHEPEKYDLILQWVYQLLDEIELPVETIEVPIYIPSEDENDCEHEECEDCNMACNCGSSANVRYCEDTGLEYRGSDGVWRPIAVIADGVTPDDETPVGETPPPEINQNACEKAHALWDTLFRYMEAVEETVPVFDFDPIPVSIEMSQFSAWWVVNMSLRHPEMPIKKVQAALYSMPQWFAAPNLHVEMDFLRANQDLLAADFTCAMYNSLSKEPKLTDSDLEKAYAYEWDTGREHLSNMMGATLHYLISEDHMKEQAALYVRAAIHTCDCLSDGAPTPPPSDGTEPPADGCIKVYPPGFALSPYNGQNFGGTIEYALSHELYGVKINDNRYETQAAGNNGSGSDLFRLGLLYILSEDTEIIQVRWDWSSPYAQGTNSRQYQPVVGSWAVESSPMATPYQSAINTGQSGSLVASINGFYTVRYAILISAFAVASTGNQNKITLSNIQFRIKHATSGFEGWVAAGTDLCN